MKLLYSILITLSWSGLLYCQELPATLEAFQPKDYHIDSKFHCLTEDSLGRMWFGSTGAGVLMYDGYEFVNIVQIPKDSTSLIDNLVQGVFSFKDKIIATTYNGYSVIDIWTLKSINKKFVNTTEVEGNNPNYSEACLVDPDGNLWIGNTHNLVLLDEDYNPTEVYELPPILNLERNRVVVRLAIDNQNSNIVWVSSLYGLYSFNLKERAFTFHYGPKKWHRFSPDLAEYAYWDMYQDNSGILWLAGMWSGGVLSFDPKTEVWHQYLYENSDVDSPYQHNAVMAIIPINDRELLLNNDKGLGILNKKEKSFNQWNGYDYKTYGPARENYFDRNGRLWIAADKGILYSKHQVLNTGFNPKTLLCKITTTYDQNDEGILLFSENTSQLSAKLALINPLEPSDVQYQFKLCDGDWVDLNSRRHIDIANLSAGSHKLNYRAKLVDGDWVNGKEILLEIEAPSYLKPHNLLLAGFLLLGLLFGAIRLFKYFAFRETKLRHIYEKQLLETEMKSLRSQMNPHFIFNSLNSIYNFILQNKTDEAADYLSKFSKLIRLVLQNSKEHSISLKEEITMLTLYLDLEQIRINNKFDYEIICENIVDQSNIQIPPMLIQPHVENAIWHGIVPSNNHGNISLAFKVHDNILHISITDNGVGRQAKLSNSKSLDKKSMGSKITKERIKILNNSGWGGANQEYEDIVDELSHPIGTQVKIVLPLVIKKVIK